MMSTILSSKKPASPPPPAKWFVGGFWVVSSLLIIYIFRQYYLYWQDNVFRDNSYYSHAVLVPFVSLFFVWRMRKDLAQIPKKQSNWGFAALALACLMVVGGDLLGVRMFGEAAVIPLLAGLVLIFLGTGHLRRMWFPLAFLVFMIPLPESMTTSITFHVKMLATDGAVWLSRALLIPMIRDGSYVRIGDESLLIGDVCGGLRSLISLVALGAIMSYISETKPWSRLLIFMVSAPVAVVSNMLRIFLLCVIANNWGSEIATGWVHDVSGVLIYVVAISLMYGLDRLLSRASPSNVPTPENAVA
jgi:exosortase